MKCKRHIPVILIISLLFGMILTGCTQPLRSSSSVELILDTIVDIKVYGHATQKSLDLAVDAAFDKARELNLIFSASDPKSELYQVNENAAHGPVVISHELFTVLETSIDYAQKTQGAFDPTLGRLIELWGIGTDHPQVPSADAISALAGRRNYEHITLDAKKSTVFYETDDFCVDLGAIAKGYIADELKRLLEEDYHIQSAILNLGGNTITIGSKPDGSDWNIGIVNPKSPDDMEHPAFYIRATGKTFVTSGNYQRYFEDETGKRYHHIFDGHTGYPSETGLDSVTIITDVSMNADALSTAVFVMGLERGMAYVESLENTEAIFIDSSGCAYATSGIKNQVTKGSLSLEPSP